MGLPFLGGCWPPSPMRVCTADSMMEGLVGKPASVGQLHFITSGVQYIGALGVVGGKGRLVITQ